MNDQPTCQPRFLPQEARHEAAETAIRVNPMNRPPVERMAALAPDKDTIRGFLAVLTTKYWRGGSVRLTVGFLDNPEAALRRRIIEHLNAWSKTADVQFAESAGEAQVRIARAGGPDGGYWSYVGTDILHIPRGQATMNLQGFTMNTPETTFRRVVRHEAGHTLGCPHEHMRRELVARIDREKAYGYFRDTQAWSRQEVDAQVLTPVEEGSLWGTDHADPFSIMCYEVPAAITVDGEPIVGGDDITGPDYTFLGQVYPMAPRPKPRDPSPWTTTQGSSCAVFFPAGADAEYVAAVVDALRRAESARKEAHGNPSLP